MLRETNFKTTKYFLILALNKFSKKMISEATVQKNAGK
jgi:hypothetical protein